MNKGRKTVKFQHDWVYKSEEDRSRSSGSEKGDVSVELRKSNN